MNGSEDVCVPVHPSDDSLELFALGHYRSEDLAFLEEHLLLCVDCQRRLRDIDAYVALMAKGTKEIQQNPPRHQRALVVCSGVLAASILVFCLMSYFRSEHDQDAEIRLAAVHGKADPPLAAPVGKSLTLKVDLTEVAPSPTYRLDVVSSSGNVIWTTIAKSDTRQLVLHVEKRLDRGTHWIRLCSDTGQVLREYALRVQ